MTGGGDVVAHPRVIVLNGGSSSGKSSIARALQEILPDMWLTFGVDTFIDALPGRGNSPKSGITYSTGGAIAVTREYTRLENAWYSALYALADAGANIILDEVLLSSHEGQQRLLARFDGLSLLWVGVHCPPEIAAARETARGDREPGMACRQAVSVHAEVSYDIEVDTSVHSPEECARTIAGSVTGFD